MNKPFSNREAIAHEALGDLRKCLEFSEEIGDLEYVDGADPQLDTAMQVNHDVQTFLRQRAGDSVPLEATQAALTRLTQISQEAAAAPRA